MVLGFGSRKKKAAAEPVFIRASPSLPELARQRIPWPEDLIDSNVVDDGVPDAPAGGARKTSFQGTAVPFHKPFRAGEASVPGTPDTGRAPPSAFSLGARTRAGSHPLSHSRSARRAKTAPTFNIMVAGAKHTGKSSLLRLLLDTSPLSPGSTPEQVRALAAFRGAAGRPTRALATACVEVLQGPEERVALTAIDTPGLDFAEGREFALDRAVSALVRYVDLQFAETLGEESKVVRASKGDRHVHVCIYLIDPDSVVTPAARRARSRLSAVLHSAAPMPADLPEPSEYDSGSDDEDDVPAAASDDGLAPGGEDADADADAAQLQTPPASQASPRRAHRLAMAPAELRVIARLAKRVNVLPVVARADTLTDGRLERVKRAVRRDLADVEGVFGVWDAEPGALFGREEEEAAPAHNGHAADAEERQARPVIRLRSRGLARSRSRKSLKAAVGAEYDAAPAAEEMASRRTSAASAPEAAVYTPPFSRAELRARMPFAMIAPERERAGTAAGSETGHAASEAGHAAPARFVRRFRWGTVDVLDPQHCDFTALRAAVLGSYMRALKAATKDVLYERFREEKLLARRATRNITDDDRKRILQDLQL